MTSNSEPSAASPSPGTQSASSTDKEATTAHQPIEAIEDHAHEHLLGMFGDPPTSICSHNNDHEIRDGSDVSLAITYDADTGIAETRHIHCGECDLPDPSEIEYGDWVGFVTGRAIATDWKENAGDCLILVEHAITGIHPVGVAADSA